MSHPNVVANQNAELTPPVYERSQNLNQHPMVTAGTIGWRTRCSMASFPWLLAECCVDVTVVVTL